MLANPLLDKDYFSLFGVAPSFYLEVGKLKQTYLSLQKIAHPDNFIDASQTEKKLVGLVSARINEAYRVLISPVQRARYFFSLHEVELEKKAVLPKTFLIEQMEFQEKIADLHSRFDPLAYDILYQQVNTAWQQAEQALYLCKCAPTSEASLCVQKMQFYAVLLNNLEKLYQCHS